MGGGNREGNVVMRRSDTILDKNGPADGILGGSWKAGSWKWVNIYSLC